MENKQIMFTDLDGTLLRHSLVLLHCGYLENLKKIDTKGAFQSWEEDMKNEHLITNCAMAYQQAIIGMSMEDMNVDDFILRTFLDSRGRFKKDMFYIEILEKLILSDEVHIVTGSPSFLVEKFSEMLGVNIFAHGSVYEYDKHMELFTGEIKVPMFTASVKDETIANIVEKYCYENRAELTFLGCGDTMSDKPIFEIADKKILVEPTIETLKNYSKMGICFDEII